MFKLSRKIKILILILVSPFFLILNLGMYLLFVLMMEVIFLRVFFDYDILPDILLLRDLLLNWISG
tara:strand:+ start:3258 stop:3455 length:198 start_codon:yes stop_codon:yes gene_type:complete